MTAPVRLQPLTERAAIERARRALTDIGSDSANLWRHWLAYGAALNDLRAQFPKKGGDDAFGAAVAELHEGVSQNVTPPNRSVRLAAMWAAANPEQLAEVTNAESEVTPKSGFRKWHAARKNRNKPRAKRRVSADLAAINAVLFPQPGVDGWALPTEDDLQRACAALKRLNRNGKSSQ